MMLYEKSTYNINTTEKNTEISEDKLYVWHSQFQKKFNE